MTFWSELKLEWVRVEIGDDLNKVLKVNLIFDLRLLSL